MLAKWPLLYPEMTGAGEQDEGPPDEAGKVGREIFAPLLETTDIHRAFDEIAEEYKKWRDSLPTEVGPRSLDLP